ncbi:MAG: hypothetical protein U0893_14010 [Chloroflexota bacterium]
MGATLQEGTALAATVSEVLRKSSNVVPAAMTRVLVTPVSTGVRAIHHEDGLGRWCRGITETGGGVHDGLEDGVGSVGDDAMTGTSSERSLLLGVVWRLLCWRNRRCAAQFLEQSSVLDGDDRLVRERLQEGHLAVREWPGPRSA